MACICQLCGEIAQTLANICRVDLKERGRRLSAALAYGDRDRAGAAKLLHVSVRTFDRRLAGQSPGLSEDDFAKIARWCGLPPAFFEIDFEEAARVLSQRSSDLLPRVEWLEEQMRLLRAGQLLGVAAAEAQRIAASGTATVPPPQVQQP